MRLLIATRNAHKLSEIRKILAPAEVQLLSLDDVEGLPDELPEDGDTFAANALQKAREAHAKTGLLTCADDSGLEVDALGGRPGVFSKRFSPEGTDPANNRHLLHLLGERTDRAARYRCVLALVGDGVEKIVDGRCEGHIGHDERGHHGFGYDPLFCPADAPGRTMAELSPEEKNAISHRGRAFLNLLPHLRALREGSQSSTPSRSRTV
ncbi:MAG: RdgB/HAM1 family non-canonical purine NTP pyrophosphatase [Deltaproteobacteria bacterium]|nr:MAG: RdgB/HAM1 family non-canonical purine NTP pyrophosphatase [Deltaproteobacteria bacterium]